jgi:hypothetical protein
LVLQLDSQNINPYIHVPPDGWSFKEKLQPQYC